MIEPEIRQRQSLRGVAKQLHAGFFRGSVFHFVGAMVALFVIMPFADNTEGGMVVEIILTTIVLASAVLAVGARRQTLFTALFLAIPAITTRWLNFAAPQILPHGVHAVTALLCISFIIYEMLRYIARAQHINAEVLGAAIGTYLMIVALFANAYAMVAVLDSGAFTFTTSNPEAPQLMKGFTALYFSAVTLSTVGYGDIVPASSVARMLAMLEAMVGVFYVAMLMARLVSGYSRIKPGSA